MDYKKAFYSKLEDCYLGAKVKEANKSTAQNSTNQSKSQSGFTNLLHIKEQYFAHIKAHLESRIKALIGNDTIESNDIYNKLYTFFDSYLNETGTPFFTDTPIYKNIYAKIYSNSKDTSLFYKTQNLYYVKSDTLYQSLILQDNLGKLSIFFDASEYKQNADNNKNKVIFKLDCITPAIADEQNEHSNSQDENPIPQITIKVTNQKDLFPDSFNVFKSNSNEFSDDFIKALSDNDLLPKKPTDSHIESLKKLFSSYKKQNEIDFFIHKNAKAFLQEQFDLWMFSYLYKDSAFQQWSEVSIKRLQNVKNLAYEIIDFIAAFEVELKAIWLKPKFAKNTQYVFSVDTILSNATNANALLASIFSDSHFESQVKEWKELNLVNEDFALSTLQESETIQTLQNDKYKFLPIDTKHLSKESRFALLSAFSDLESLLNGELIKSDNFQALNSIMPKYQGKIDLIYIDPPFNTGSDFEYKDKFQDSTWLSLMENRLELAKNLLNSNGAFWLQLDFNADSKGRILLDDILGQDSFINEIFWKRRQGLVNQSASFGANIDTIFYYAKNPENYIFNPQYTKYNTDDYIKERYIYKDENGRVYKLGDLGSPSYSPTLIYEYKGYKPPRKGWALSLETMKKFDREGRIWFPDNKSKRLMRKQYLDEWKGKYVQCLWDDIFPINSQAIEKIEGQLTQKPESLLKRIIDTSSNQNFTILDFFAGSGTTCAAALKLGRKFLGVEMGEHFYKVIIPRLKKVIAGFQSGISKEAEYKGGGAFRYYELESYEEALANCEYVLDENSIIDYRKSRKLIKELNKECDKPITLNMSGYRAEFDIFQTIANLMGWKIKRLFLDKTIESCEYSNGEILNAQNLDIAKYPKLKTLIFWTSDNAK